LPERKTPIPPNAGREVQSCVKSVKLNHFGSEFIFKKHPKIIGSF